MGKQFMCDSTEHRTICTTTTDIEARTILMEIPDVQTERHKEQIVKTFARHLEEVISGNVEF